MIAGNNLLNIAILAKPQLLGTSVTDNSYAQKPLHVPEHMEAILGNQLLFYLLKLLPVLLPQYGHNIINVEEQNELLIDKEIRLSRDRLKA